MQFRVLKRDNQICGLCEKPVLDDDIHFDHIIPWSKGGPTAEYNLRLLCGPCNQKRGTNFEADYLIQSVQDHVIEPVDSTFIKFILGLISRAQDWRIKHQRMPLAADICKMMGARKVTSAEQIFAQMLVDLATFFEGKPPEELSKASFDSLKRRWGYEDGIVYRLRDVVTPKSPLSDVFRAEQDLVRRLGWPVKASVSEDKKWERT
jgi:hypothetical protein